MVCHGGDLMKEMFIMSKSYDRVVTLVKSKVSNKQVSVMAAIR